MPRMYSAEFRERAIALVDEGRTLRSVAADLGLAEATMYRWYQQVRIDRGELPGTTTVESQQLRDALRRIKDLEEELAATKLAAGMLRDEGIRPKGGSRSLRP